MSKLLIGNWGTERELEVADAAFVTDLRRIVRERGIDRVEPFYLDEAEQTERALRPLFPGRASASARHGQDMKTPVAAQLAGQR